MSGDPIAIRYAQALFEAVKAEGQVDQTLEQLSRLGQLLQEHAELRQLLFNPGVEPVEKVAMLDRVLKGGWSSFVRAFVNMVIALGRSESLAKMVEEFQAAVDADHGRLRVIVRSAYPLSDAVLSRLRTRLEHREQQQVELDSELVPELLGGLQIVLGHRLIDGSVKRELTELRERLMAVRV